MSVLVLCTISSIMLYISEQITMYRFEALLEISDKLSIKLNVFSYMILQCWLNILKKFITILYDFEKHSGQVVSLEIPQLVQQEVSLFKGKEMNLFKMGEDMKIKILFGNQRTVMSDKMVKNGVSQGFIFHAIIPLGRQSGCSSYMISTVSWLPS